jgi:hypothetical protein
MTWNIHRAALERLSVSSAKFWHETMHMIRKGQIAGAGRGNIQAQNQFIAGLLGLGA